MENKLLKLISLAVDKENVLFALVLRICEKRHIMYRSLTVFFILGLLSAFSRPSMYVAEVMIVPQTRMAFLKNNRLRALSSIAGTNIDEDIFIRPLMYKQIVSSIPFQLEILKTQISVKDTNKNISLADYYANKKKISGIRMIRKYTLGLPFLLLKALRGKPKEIPDFLPNTAKSDGIIRLTKEQQIATKRLKKLIQVRRPEKSRCISLRCRFPEALPAAQIVQRAQELLQKRIIDIKTEKSQARLDFLQQRYDEAKTKYEKKQLALATFYDQNKDRSTQKVKSEAFLLKDESEIAYSVYRRLAKQLKHAQIAVRKETPVFTVVKPVSIPVEKTSSKRFLTIIKWLVLGSILGGGIILGRQFIDEEIKGN